MTRPGMKLFLGLVLALALLGGDLVALMAH